MTGYNRIHGIVWFKILPCWSKIVFNLYQIFFLLCFVLFCDFGSSLNFWNRLMFYHFNYKL